jgi:exo-beta-1,3-glucanase (GH17 family)
MPTSINTRKLSYNSAKLLRDSVRDAATNTSPVLYVTLGNSVPYNNEASPDNLVDTINTEKAAFENIFAGKKVTGNDIELVIPKVNWTGSTKYRQYDDTIDVETLVTANTYIELKTNVCNYFNTKCLQVFIKFGQCKLNRRTNR